MSKAVPTEAEKTQFDTAVRNFTPSLPRKFQMLLPFKDGIAELRRKGASYETIADILREINVTVSFDTVTRFCREVLELAPAGRKRRKPGAGSSAQHPRSRQKPANAGDHAKSAGRVADPNNI